MATRSWTRWTIEALLGVFSAAMLAITAVVPDWIEQLFGLSPDGGDGSAEWGFALALALLTLLFLADAGRLWLRSRSMSSTP